MAKATGGATWRSLRLNGNLRGRQAGVVAGRAQRPYRDPTSDDRVYVPEEKHITDMPRLVGPRACPVAATACVTRTGQGLDKSGRGSRAQLSGDGAGKPRRSAPATGGTREGRKDVGRITASTLWRPPGRVRARRSRLPSMADPRAEPPSGTGAVSAHRAAAPHPILPLNAPSRALGCDAPAVRSCSVPVAVSLRSMAAVSQ